jgi:hypothetical protein
MTESGINRGLIETENNPIAAHQNRPLDQIRIFGHEPQRLGARRWILFHAALAVEIVTRVQKRFVITLADQTIQLRDRELLVEIGLFERYTFFAKQTLRFAAGGSSGL